MSLKYHEWISVAGMLIIIGIYVKKSFHMLHGTFIRFLSWSLIYTVSSFKFTLVCKIIRKMLTYNKMSKLCITKNLYNVFLYYLT